MPKVKKDNGQNSGIQAVRFSIGFKLVTIITILVLFSLGIITFLVSMMVSQDVRLTAEDNNFTVNQRSAAAAETAINGIHSNALVLLDILNTTGSDLTIKTAEFFFARNQNVAALAVLPPPSASLTPSLSSAKLTTELFLFNTGFFLSREIESSLAESFIKDKQEEAGRAAAGAAILLNATPHFGASVMALFFPWENRAALVLFSPEELSENLGTGTNMSFLLNSNGDILVHPDYELVRAGANVSNQTFVSNMWKNPSLRAQILYTSEEGVRFFGAFTKLNIAGAAVITVIEYNKVFEGIVATTFRNGYLTAAVLFLSILFIWFFSKRISGPLRLLADAALKIEGGTFEVNLKSKTHDEIGLLTSSFKRMSAALGIFGRFTNREIAVRAMRGEIKPGGLPKHATIFFSDIRGFTEKSENFTKHFGEDASNKIVYWLNEYLTRMVECVEQTGGVVDKFIGDAVMAHWGTAYSAGSPEADAMNCLKASLMMRKALEEMNKNRLEDDPANPPIHIGCGINTGIVTAGQIGSEIRMEYTVIGDPVNLASRTEALNKPLGTDILITEDTWKLVGSELITEEMPPVRVKGKAKPIRMFAVIDLKDAEGSVDSRGPKTLAELRKRLGIKAPNMSKVDTGKEEKKYKIGGN
ncbi:adenylate/guanylate cyclase domain-containing protein [Spirochaetia bacterium]|nr:adenylate/guanylate cyclase domain-containing protein [Spirochaetia bacterium]